MFQATPLLALAPMQEVTDSGEEDSRRDRRQHHQAQKLLARTGAHGLMIGRGAIRSPCCSTSSAQTVAEFDRICREFLDHDEPMAMLPAELTTAPSPFAVACG